MAEGGQKRDPSTHRTPGQTKRHRKEYQQTPEQREIARKRAKLRYDAEKKGIVHNNDGKDLAHKRAVVNGGSFSLSNVVPQSPHKNRGHGMTDGAKANMHKKRR